MSELVPILKVEGLKKVYPGVRGRPNHVALDGVSFSVRPGTTLGVVGESGSGKSTLAKILLQLTSADSGRAIFDGTDILNADRSSRRDLARRIQIVFQNPDSCLNPRRTIRAALAEAYRVAHPNAEGEENALAELLEAVGISPEKLGAMPNQLSGGQKQRVAIARALAVSPKLIVADECVSALDVSVQSAILNLMLQLQRDRDLTYVFISHDISVIRHMSDDVIVMKSGKVVEAGPAETLLENPSDSYTRELLASVLFEAQS